MVSPLFLLTQGPSPVASFRASSSASAARSDLSWHWRQSCLGQNHSDTQGFLLPRSSTIVVPSLWTRPVDSSWTYIWYCSGPGGWPYALTQGNKHYHLNFLDKFRRLLCFLLTVMSFLFLPVTFLTGITGIYPPSFPLFLFLPLHVKWKYFHWSYWLATSLWLMIKSSSVQRFAFSNINM